MTPSLSGRPGPTTGSVDRAAGPPRARASWTPSATEVFCVPEGDGVTRPFEPPSLIVLVVQLHAPRADPVVHGAGDIDLAPGHGIRALRTVRLTNLRSAVRCAGRIPAEVFAEPVTDACPEGRMLLRRELRDRAVGDNLLRDSKGRAFEMVPAIKLAHEGDEVSFLVVPRHLLALRSAQPPPPHLRRSHALVKRRLPSLRQIEEPGRSSSRSLT